MTLPARDESPSSAPRTALRIVWSPRYEVDIGAHVFPTRKYRLVRQRLLDHDELDPALFVHPVPATDDDVRLVHTAEYVHKIRHNRLSPADRLILEVPFSPALREAMWLCTGGTALAARCALQDGVAVHLGGGFHHAFPDHGEGFCLINDVAVAIRMLQRAGVAERALVIDLDVHHGNGTAAIFAGDESVFTFSMHQQDNYPLEKPPSDLDLGLDDRTADEHYLRLLGDALPRLVRDRPPDVAFYLAGADPYEHDQLGGLALTIAGLRRRDELVLGYLRRTGIPVAVTLAGGYALNPDDTVEIHCNTVREAIAAAGR